MRIPQEHISSIDEARALRWAGKPFKHAPTAAKLTPSDVLAIRELRKQGVPVKLMALTYRVSAACVYGVLSKATWRRVKVEQRPRVRW